MCSLNKPDNSALTIVKNGISCIVSWSMNWALRTNRLATKYFISWGLHQKEVCRSKARTLEEWEQQILDPFAALHVYVVRKSFESLSSKLQECVQSSGACDNM